MRVTVKGTIAVSVRVYVLSVLEWVLFSCGSDFWIGEYSYPEVVSAHGVP